MREALYKKRQRRKDGRKEGWIDVERTGRREGASRRDGESKEWPGAGKI